jgi:hypothetical protein
MENTTAPENPTVTEKVTQLAATAATDLVRGTETVVRDGAQALTEAAARTVEAGNAAAEDVAAASEEIARRLRGSVATPPVPTTVPAPPIPLAATVAASV